ncbi:MAG: cell cycle transcriptional regulator TrcR [Alphaproteobacteria bacterium]
MALVAKKPKHVLLMPKASAVWLIENTALTFRQIADFANLTEIEIEALANEDIGRGLVGRNPIENNELTKEELARCEADPKATLKACRSDLPQVKMRAKGPRYTPVSKRADKPDSIAYILKHNPEISDAQICKLVGTTKPTINSIRDRTNPNSSTIRPRHPADAGLCTYQEYEKAVNKGLKAAGKDPEKIKLERAAALDAANPAPQETKDITGTAGFDFSNFLPKKDQTKVPLDD